MPIKTKRWDEERQSDDGFRLLITRYRPRGVSKSAETWDQWIPALGSSKELHRAVYPREGSPISWPTYRARYLVEQRANRELIRSLAERSKGGETITLLCSSACVREARCHRSILRDLIEADEKSPSPS